MPPPRPLLRRPRLPPSTFSRTCSSSSRWTSCWVVHGEIRSFLARVESPSQHTRSEETHPLSPRRLAFPAHLASLGQKKLPASCQKRDRRQRPGRKEASRLPGATDSLAAPGWLSRRGARALQGTGPAVAVLSSVALRLWGLSPPAAERSRVPRVGRRILSH